MKSLVVKLAITEPGIGAGAELADTLRVLANRIEGFENADFEPGMESGMTDGNGASAFGKWEVTEPNERN